MKYFAAFVAALALLISASQAAVTWRTVSISIKVNQGGADITTTILNSRKYLEKGVSVSAGILGFPDSDPTHYFVGMRSDTGVVAVVHIPTGTIVYNIVSGVTLRGAAFDGLATKGTGAASATVSSLNTDFNGFYYDKVTQKIVNGTLQVKSIGRQVMGGNGNQTISGTIRTTADRFDF